MPRVWEAWTTEEIETLEQAYVSEGGGLVAAMAALPHRTRNQIRGKVEYLKFRLHGRANYRKQIATPEIDAAIRAAYRHAEPRLAELSRTTNRTHGWLKWRAGELGVRRVCDARYNVPWTEEESAIFTEGVEAGRTLGAIHKRLRNAGFNRSLTALQSRMQKQKLKSCRNGMTAHEVARLMNIDSHCVYRWLEQGKLKGKREVGPTVACYPDERGRLMWQIHSEALRDFMVHHPGDWDHRKVDKIALLDILCGGKYGLTFQGMV